MKKSLKIIIAEKRMRDLVGHFADVTKRICVAGQNRGLNFDVYYSSSADSALANFLLEPNVQLCPVLKPLALPTWEKILSIAVGRDNYKRWRKKMFPALRSAYSSEVLNAPLFLPTADVSDVLGILRHERRFPCVLGFWYSPEMEFPGATDVLLKALAAGDTTNLQIGAYDDETLKDLSKLKKHVAVVRLPCPYDQEVEFTNNPTKDVIKVGFFGFMGRERGGQIKHKLKQLCFAAGFEVLDESKTSRKQSRSENNTPNYAMALGETMSKCDIVVWPSDADAYALRTSGIVFHCIANGMPVVVPEKCRPALILQNANHPHETFSKNDPEQIIEAIVKLAKRIVSAKSLAQNSSMNFNSTEGSIALVEYLYRQMRR